MAISFIGGTAGGGGGASVGLPGAFANGDIVIAVAYNRTNTNVPGAPTGGTYNLVATANPGSHFPTSVYYRVISGDTTFPGFPSNVTHYALAVYRGQNKGDPIGASATAGAISATMSYANFAEEYTDSTSWVIECGSHRNDSVGSTVIGALATQRAFYNTEGGTPAGKIGIGDVQNISSWSGDSCTTGGASNSYTTVSFELKAEKTVAADPATYTITPTEATLTYTPSTGYDLAADPGAVVITGTDAGLFVGRKVAAESAAYTITGTDATLTADRRLAADPASYVITGTDADFVAPISQLTDDFTSLDATDKWEIRAGTVSIDTGRLALVAATDYAILRTRKAYSIGDGGVIFATAVDFGSETNADGRDIQIIICDADDPEDQRRGFTIDAYFNATAVRYIDGAATYPAALAISAGNFLRLRVDGATLYWEISTNFSTWNTVYSDTAPAWLDRVKVDFLAGHWNGGETPTVTALWDNLNVETGVYTLAAESAAYTITPTEANLEAHREVVAESAAYTITGTDAGLFVGRKVAADPGAVAITGTPVTLTWSGETPAPGRVRDGDGGPATSGGRRRRRYGARVYRWQLGEQPIEDAAEEIVEALNDVQADEVVEFVDQNADILALLGVEVAPIVERMEATPTPMLPEVAEVEMARILAAIEDFIDEEETLELLIAS